MGCNEIDPSGNAGCFSLLGTSLTSVQADWLKAPNVLLMLDGDNPGRKAALSIAQTLCSMTSVFIYNLPDGLEPENLSDSELMSIVSDFIFFLTSTLGLLLSAQLRCAKQIIRNTLFCFGAHQIT